MSEVEPTLFRLDGCSCTSRLRGRGMDCLIAVEGLIELAFISFMNMKTWTLEYSAEQRQKKRGCERCSNTKLPFVASPFPRQSPVSRACVDWRMTKDFLAGASWDQVYAANATVSNAPSASTKRANSSDFFWFLRVCRMILIRHHGGLVVQRSGCSSHGRCR